MTYDKLRTNYFS